MITVDVDFNNIDGQGRVRTLPSHQFDELPLGTHVLAVDSLEEMEFEAVVAERSEDGSLILEMMWSQSTASEPPVKYNFDFPSTSWAMTSFAWHMPIAAMSPHTSGASSEAFHAAGTAH